MHPGITHIYDFRWYKWEKIDDAFVKCVKIMLKSYQNHISVHLFIVSLLVANALSVIIINVVRSLSLASFAAKVISVRKYLCYDRSTKYLAIAVIAVHIVACKVAVRVFVYQFRKHWLHL